MWTKWRCATVGLMLAGSLLVMSSCHKEPKPEEKGSSVTPVAVEICPVATGKFADVVEVVGSLSPKKEAFVRAEYQAVVTKIFVSEWVHVKTGDPLAQLDTSELEVQKEKNKTQVDVNRALLLKAEVASNRANRELERLLKLKEVGLVTQQNLDDARTQKEAAEADIKAAQSQIRSAEEDVHQVETRLAKSILRAPMEGMVAERRPNAGDLVGDPTSSEPLFRIVDNRVMNLNLEVPSTKLSLIRVGQSLQFSTEAIPGKTFSGRISFINPTADATSRSVKVQAEVPNGSGDLRPGLFVKGQINTGRQSESLQIPKTSLMSWDVGSGQAEVFLADGETARRRKIQTGRVDNERVEVTGGLSAGQPVISRGVFNVHDGERIKVVK